MNEINISKFDIMNAKNLLKVLTFKHHFHYGGIVINFGF